jgi:ferredoxin-NADP reductase
MTMEPRLEWQRAGVTAIQPETPRAKTLTLALPAWMRHQAGQHYDLRLTAADGYQAQRSYSIASPPEREGVIQLTVERLEDGEVSPYLHDVVMVGDQIEVRGPIGGYFVWEASMTRPVFLIAGGSGVVPLMAMVRHRAAARAQVPFVLLYSCRTPDDAIYRAELDQMGAADRTLRVVYTFTRSAPQGWTGYTRRIDPAMLREVSDPLGGNAQAYVCGPTLLVEAAADALVTLGWQAAMVRTERFGPTGGPS